MMKYERGYSCEFIANNCGVEVTTLSWQDDRVVNLIISTYVDAKQILNSYIVEKEPQTVKRFDTNEKSVKGIPCPEIIKDYNCHMDVVDLIDSSMSRHRIM